MDNLTPESYLYMLDGSEYQAAERHIKVVEADDIFKSAAWFELMGCFISFHWPPIVGKAIITDEFQFVKREYVISNNKSPTL